MCIILFVGTEWIRLQSEMCIRDRCMGTACYVKGAGDVLERIQKRLGIEPGGTTPDGRFSLEATRCIGACGLAPVMTINEDVYGRLTPDEVDKILDKYL